MLSRNTSTAGLGALLLFGGDLLVLITVGTPGAGDNVAVAGPALSLPVARATACPVGVKDRSCPCRALVEARGTLVGWLAAPREETPAPAPTWGLPCVAVPVGRAAMLGAPLCSPLLLAGASGLAATCCTRLPVGRDKVAPAGSTPLWPQQAGTCP